MQKFRFIIIGALGIIILYLVYQSLTPNSGSQVAIDINPTNEFGINPGDIAPELSFENPDGEVLSLSSLRGSIVLIDFWAGWCAPCRRENPNIVEAYKNYNDKEFINGSGFSVYGVSLDKKREQWLGSIAEDNLIWPYHVSDLKGWNSVAAALYQVNSIPANFLIDGNGMIIARNIKGKVLHDTLESLLKK